MLQTVRLVKVDETTGVICLVFMFPSWVMVLKLSKKVYFCDFVLTPAENLSLLEQSTYMHICLWKVSLCTFRKWYCLLCYDLRFGDIRVWSEIILLNFCWISIFFYIYLMSSGSEPYKPYYFWKECNESFHLHVCKLL